MNIDIKTKTTKRAALVATFASVIFSLRAAAVAPEEPIQTEEPADSVCSVELDDLVVVEMRKLVQSDGAKLTYNVSEDPEAGSSSILEILRKVPGVTVDADENVKVNGQTSFRILMNGRENAMLQGDIKTVLKSLPAATIKKIEVISEPGAKYEAEGIGGILNIVTDRTTDLSGFMTQAMAWGNANGIGANLSGRVKLNKVMLDASVSYNTGNLWQRPIDQKRTYEYLDDSGRGTMQSDSRFRNGWQSTMGTVNMSWEPDTLNLFTFTGSFFKSPNSVNSDEHRSMTDREGTPLWDVTRSLRRSNDSDGCHLQASYQRNFGRDDNTLVFSYLYNFNHTYGHSNSTTESAWNYTEETPFSSIASNNRMHNHIFQIDYSNEFNEHHKLETGGKGTILRNRAANSTWAGTSAADAAEQTDAAVDMLLFRDIYSLYASYNGSFSKWNVNGGLRYEFTRMGLNYSLGDYPDFTSTLHDLVPNAAVSYNFTRASNLRLGYQMRIGRPGIYAVNPFVDTQTPGVLAYGNPDLESQKSHNASLTYSNYDNKLSGMAKLTYTHVANAIYDVIFVKDGMVNMTYANIGKEDAVSLDLNLSWNITNALRWSVYGNVEYSYAHARSELLNQTQAGWTTYLSTDVNYMLPGKVRLSADVGYWSGWYDIQSHGNGGYYYGFGASRSFLKDNALTISLSLDNPAPPKRSNRYVQTDQSIRLTHLHEYQQWNVGLRISYRFGGLKASVKRTAAAIESDDEGGGSGSAKQK